MTDLEKYSLSELLDLLSQHTAGHIRVLAQSTSRQDLESSKAKLKQIQAEIEKRKAAKPGNNFNNLPGEQMQAT
jgi:hypothetical protein